MNEIVQDVPLLFMQRVICNCTNLLNAVSYNQDVAKEIQSHERRIKYTAVRTTGKGGTYDQRTAYVM